MKVLRHIERTRLLVHVVDISGSEGRDPWEDYLAINRELSKYGEKVAKLPQIIALNKCDMLEDNRVIDNFKKKILDDNINVFAISAYAHSGLDELIECVIKTLDKLPKVDRVEIEEEYIDKRNLREFSVRQIEDGLFEVTGELVFEIMKRVNLDDMASNNYFQKRIKNDGIIDALIEIGLQEGDMIRIGDYELQYFE